MTYYHSEFVKMVGGLKGRPMRRIVGATWEDMVKVSRERPEISVINRPAMKVGSWKSKSLPVLRIDGDASEILDEIGSDQVSEDHILVQTWILRRELYARSFEITEEIDAFFDKGIRGSLRELLKKGLWIDQPPTVGLQNLNNRLEKIDLGRRSDLKFSSEQPIEPGRYDRDAKRVDIRDPDQEYLGETPKGREYLRNQKPWMASKWIEKYGV